MSAAPISIPVPPPPPFTTKFLVGVAAFFGCLLVYVYLNPATPLAPEEARGKLLGMLAMGGVLVALVCGMMWAVRRRSLTLTDTDLVVRAGFYTRRLPRAALRPMAAVECSLFERREYAPRWRTNGIRVPGFQAGWFRLANREKALVLLTDPLHVTYLPTTAGYALLVSTEGLLPALREAERAAD